MLAIPAIYVLGWASTVEWDEEKICIHETQFGFSKKKTTHLWARIRSIKMRKIVQHRVPQYEFEFIDDLGKSVFENPLPTDGLIGLKQALLVVALHHKIPIVEI